MKRPGWQTTLGISLVVLSIVLYTVHYYIFEDLHHIFIYMVGDLAFLPIEVLLVTIIIHSILNQREKRSRMEKLNMVIGTFFSEVGTELLTYFSDYDPRLDELRNELVITGEWTDRDFKNMSKKMKNYEFKVDMDRLRLEDLRDFLKERRDFLMRLLENPNLLEHEDFTDLLRAVFHLMEELSIRDELKKIPESDIEHVSVDVQRSYSLLVVQWLDYMEHLKDNFPFLFSLAMRINPFDSEASATVR